MKRQSLTSAELGRFLRQLSNLYRDDKLGNPLLSEALAELASVLIAGGSRSSAEVARSSLSSMQPALFDTGRSFTDLSAQAVQQILSDEEESRSELIRLGSERFAISRSKLKRSNRQDIIDAIRAALQNEESLGIISEEARRGGQDRSS